MSKKQLSIPEDIEELSDVFSKQLDQALKHFLDPVWLGENSSLAARYFLGKYVSKQSEKLLDNPRQRGEALREVLREAAYLLGVESGDGRIDYKKLLEVAYFRRRTRRDFWEDIPMSRANYFLHRKPAIKQLGDILLRLVSPTLRPELPPLPSQIVGRGDVITACTQALQQPKTVGLVGPGGIGKTALGASLARKLAPQKTFWFTFRPGLNDRLRSLLFALGYFLHSQGSSQLWGLLVGGEGEIRPDVALSLIRYDLGQIKGGLPLLCFDEMDLLNPAEKESHAQLLEFLVSLQGLTPLLVMGQQLVLEPDALYTLTGLEKPDLENLLAQAQIQLSPDNLARLRAHTQGNPRLVELFIALHQSGESMTDVLSNQAGVPSVEFLLDRIWRRLSDVEQDRLTELAVFRRPAPGDAWDRDDLNHLITRHLVQADDQGGVMVLPAFKEVIYPALGPEYRQALHLKAATIRAMRGEYTAAAYHYLKGQQPQVAIWLWHEHQTQEINQGQAETALLLLREISPEQLTRADQEALSVINSTLNKLLGQYERAQGELRRTFWHSPTLKTQARRLEGDIAELKSEFSRAQRAYREGLETVERLISEKALFRKNLAWVLTRERDLDQAFHQARLAEYEIEDLLGYIQEERGNYAEAERYYRSALALTKTLRHTRGEAKTCNNLANLLSRQGKFDEAMAYRQQAGQLFERIHDLAKLAEVRVNLAFDYNLADQPEAAIAPATEALEMFERLGEAYGLAVAAQNLAEAHLALGNLAEAEQFARQVVQTEEDNTLPDGLRVLGEVKLKQKNYAAAEQYIREAINVAQQIDDRFLEAYAWRALAQTYQAQKRKKEADEACEKAITLFEDLGLTTEVEKTKRMGDSDDNASSAPTIEEGEEG